MSQSIGFFQFDNLVKGRVPFLFINLGVDTSAVYPHVFKMHLERLQIMLTQGDPASVSIETVVSKIRNQNTPTESAIVILCADGVKSVKIAQTLESFGYNNVFYVQGGWKQILEEKKQF